MRLLSRETGWRSLTGVQNVGGDDPSFVDQLFGTCDMIYMRPRFFKRRMWFQRAGGLNAWELQASSSLG